MQTGTKLVDGGIDENGAPLYKRVPVVEDVQLPVALRPVKEALRPIYDRLMRQMPVAQQQASAGLKAISNIVNGPDFESASITDENLGAIKQIAREANSPVSQGLAKAAVQQLDAAVQQAVARAGPDAVAALQQGRAETIAKYASQSVKDSLGLSADNPEPAAAVAKLTQPGDKSINLLRSVAEETPEHIPLIAQSLVSGLLDKVTAEAGQAKPQSALTAWQKIGDQTKQVLFQSPEKVQALNDFFTLAKKMGENPNPSGSGQLLALVKGVGLVVTSPATAIPWILGAKPLARLLFTPTGARNLILASKLPAVGSGAIGARLADSILAGAGKDGVTPVTANAGAGTAAASPAAVDATQSGRGAATPAASSPLAAGSTGSGRAASGHVPAEAGAAAGTVGGARSADTVIPIPGKSGRSYQARYQFVERRDLVGSHNGNNFQPDPRFPLKNDRQYKTVVNQGKIVNGASRKDFNPDLLVNDNPDATNGPPVTDEDNVTLAGNGRKAILDRVYSGNPQGAAAYRALLAKKAAQFGLDPSDLAGMDEPVLVRKIANSEFKDTTAKQNAITDFNKTGTAALTPAERAIADSRRVSTGTLDDVAARLDEKGPDATMGDVLEGKGGGEILQKLITDGVVSPQEQAAFVNSATNELTKAGRERIGQLMIGRFFSDPAQMESAAPSVRARIERMAAPLAQVEAKGDWNLTPDVQTAVDLLDAARRQGIKSVSDFVAQDGLFGKDKYSPQSIAIAKALQTAKSAELTKAARQYAQDAAYADQGPSLLGDAPTPAESFKESFGALKSGAQVDADGAMRQARNAQYSRKILRVAPEDQAQVSYRPGQKGAPGILYGNAAATELMSHLLGGNGFDGVNLPPELAERVAARARWELYNSAFPKVMRNELRNFADQLDQVVALKRGVNYTEAEPGTPISAIKATAREEAFHAQQRELGDVGHIGNASVFMENRLAQKAGDTLTREYGYADDSDTLAAEIGAKLAGGKWEEMGLSESEGQQLAYQYARALVLRHGPGVVFNLRRISPILREAFHEAGRYGTEPPENFPGTTGTIAKPLGSAKAQPPSP